MDDGSCEDKRVSGTIIGSLCSNPRCLDNLLFFVFKANWRGSYGQRSISDFPVSTIFPYNICFKKNVVTKC